MDDLISRKAAIESIKDPVVKGFALYALKNVPSVPAVPLDKLCEWLANHYEPPYSLLEVNDLKWPIDFREQKEIWKVALTKWMEGLDGSESMVQKT